MSIKLNESQMNAVKHTKGPLRIIAGPGSGKTRTIVSKIAYVINNGLAKPEEILTISFTNKATNEIKERIKSEDGIEVKGIYTYHGWCNYFLRTEAEYIGLTKDFTIIDSQDSSSRVNSLIKENNFTVDKSDVLTIFDKISREEISVKKLNESSSIINIQISKLWEQYKNNKKVNGQLDFNDLISEVKNLLVSNDDIAKKWKSKYKYIFIDEFQDTNNIQFQIIKSLTDENSNLTVVGDPDQNIYSWRGANIELINNFNKWYPTLKTIFLNKNYRSTPEIIQASNALIKNNFNRIVEFSSLPEKSSSYPVEIIEKENDMEEAWELIKKIEEMVDTGYEYHDIAIIVRSSYKTRPLETALNHHSIPYRVIGAVKFFDRKEIKQTMKFLLFAAKQDDSTLLNIINEPPKKYGPKKILKLKAESLDAKMTMWEYLTFSIKKQSLPMQDWIKNTKDMIFSILNGEDASIVMQKYLKDIGYFNRIFDEASKYKNVEEFLKLIRTSLNLKNNLSIKEKIIQFLNNSILSSSSDKTIEKGEVNIITAHASKGTEFPIVFLYSMVEGHWPSNRSIENEDIEEERRVVYVAMTRAMDRLFITTSNGWTIYNKELKQSRFVDELLTTNTYNYININNEKPRIPNVNFKDENKYSSNVGKNIFHIIFGEGTITHNDGEFINVKFYNGKSQEILIGHKSYKVIK